MGGDLFQGTQKLTNQQYQQICQVLTSTLKPFCRRIEPYTPMPEKQIHGDVDFIILLKNPFTQTDILNELKPKQFKISNNENSLNMVYKKKQVDFLFVGSENQFELVWFYKSYSGFGGYLGTFFSSKIIKLTHKGLYTPICHFHLKVQLLVCDNVQKMMEFYGLDYQRHIKGYKTKKELFEFLKTARFLDEVRYVQQVQQVKGTSKLMWAMVEYLNETGIDKGRKPVVLENVLKQSLEFFGKKQAYVQALNKLIAFKNKNEEMNQKFNARHILQHFDIPIKKQVDHIKVKFKTVMFEQKEQNYLDYVERHSIDEILKDFGKVCDLKVKQNVKEEIIENKSKQETKEKLI